MSNYTDKVIKEFREKNFGRMDVDLFSGFEQFLPDKLKEQEAMINEEWESRGILTECHNCGKIVHIFPEDASRLMKEYCGEAVKEAKGEV